jgi:NAD(P)H dehydrogenase (quinone)
MKYLVTGATGGLGAKAVEYLAATGHAEDTAAMARDLRKAESLKAEGVQVRQGDYEDAASLEKAFAGVERLLLVSSMGDNGTRIRHHLNAVAAARKAGVGRIVYTSAAKADSSPLGLAEVHRVTEEAIRESGIPFTFLRNNWYVENEAASLQAAAGGTPMVSAAGDGRVGWAPRAEYAEAAARALVAEGHAGRTYELAGPLHTFADLAGAVSQATGRKVELLPVDDAAHRGILGKYGLPGFVVDLVVDIHRSIRAGALDVASQDLETLLGRPVTPLREAVAAVLKPAQAVA